MFRVAPTVFLTSKLRIRLLKQHAVLAASSFSGVTARQRSSGWRGNQAGAASWAQPKKTNQQRAVTAEQTSIFIGSGKSDDETLAFRLKTSIKYLPVYNIYMGNKLSGFVHTEIIVL